MNGFLPRVTVAALLLASPAVAVAYIGPGTGITAIGTVIALVGAIVLAIVGFVWYPIKRLRARMKEKRSEEQGDQPAPPS